MNTAPPIMNTAPPIMNTAPPIMIDVGKRQWIRTGEVSGSIDVILGNETDLILGQWSVGKGAENTIAMWWESGNRRGC